MAIQLVLLGALFTAVVLVIAGLVPSSSGRLENAAPGWIAAGIVLELIACASYALLFHGVFSYGEYRIGYIRSAQIGVGELGAFVVVPTGAGGPALRIWALLRSGMPFRPLMTRSVIHGAVFNLPYVLAAILLGVGVVTRVGAGHAKLFVALAPLGLVIGTLALVGVAIAVARREPAAPRTRWRRIGWDIVHAFPDGIHELPIRLRDPALLLWALGYWAGDCGVLIVAFQAVHASPPIGVIVLAYMLGQLGNTLPLPGGVGAVEPAMLGVLTASGVNLGVAAAAVVLYRLISLGIQATAGALAVGTLVPALERAPAEQR